MKIQLYILSGFVAAYCSGTGKFIRNFIGPLSEAQARKWADLRGYEIDSEIRRVDS